MAVLKQTRAGFKFSGNKIPIEGITTPLKILRAKQQRAYSSTAKSFDANGRKALRKIIVEDKAKKMLESLKPNEAVVFNEMLQEIRLNSELAISDIAVNIIRKLKQKNPNGYYTVGAVIRLYKAGVKSGAIKSQ